jgi:hypothetical protein
LMCIRCQLLLGAVCVQHVLAGDLPPQADWQPDEKSKRVISCVHVNNVVVDQLLHKCTATILCTHSLSMSPAPASSLSMSPAPASSLSMSPAPASSLLLPRKLLTDVGCEAVDDVCRAASVDEDATAATLALPGLPDWL